MRTDLSLLANTLILHTVIIANQAKPHVPVDRVLNLHNRRDMAAGPRRSATLLLSMAAQEYSSQTLCSSIPPTTHLPPTTNRAGCRRKHSTHSWRKGGFRRRAQAPQVARWTVRCGLLRHRPEPSMQAAPLLFRERTTTTGTCSIHLLPSLSLTPLPRLFWRSFARPERHLPKRRKGCCLPCELTRSGSTRVTLAPKVSLLCTPTAAGASIETQRRRARTRRI